MSVQPEDTRHLVVPAVKGRVESRAARRRVEGRVNIAERGHRAVRAPQERSIRQNLNLAFLSPAIVRAAIDGTLPDGAGISQFIDAPMIWAEHDSY